MHVNEMYIKINRKEEAEEGTHTGTTGEPHGDHTGTTTRVTQWGGDGGRGPLDVQIQRRRGLRV